MSEQIIYCCQCNSDVKPRLTNGREIYPHRSDLHSLPFWKCECGNFVGCHHKTKKPTTPLGCIPTKEIKDARKKIHALLDPIWQSGKVSRKHLYARLTEKLGRQYHTAELRSVNECELILAELNNMELIGEVK